MQRDWPVDRARAPFHLSIMDGSVPYKYISSIARFFSVWCMLFCLSGCSGFFSGNREVPISQLSMNELTHFFVTSDFGFSIPFLNDRKPGTIVFVMNFDGTNNDREQVPPGETKTVVAQLFDRIEGNQVDKPPRYPGSIVRKAYLRGPGCADSYWCLLDQAFGRSSSATADDAFAQLKRFIAENPQATEVKVLVIGFSRGAATARHFLNKVYQASTQSTLGTSASVWSSAILIETVATGQHGILELTLPPNVEFALNLVAKNETRALFPPVIDADPDYERYTNGLKVYGIKKRIFTVRLPGAHSDLGDSYDSGAGPHVSKVAINIIEKMGLKTPCSGFCPDDLVDISVLKPFDGCSGAGGQLNKRMVSDGLHDSRGKLDLLMGAPSPYSKGFHREDDAVQAAPMTDELADRLFWHINDQVNARSSDVGTITEFTQRNNFVFTRSSGSTDWKQIESDGQSKGRLGYSLGVPALLFKAGKLPLPEAVLETLKTEKGDVILEAALSKCRFHWFINGYIPGDQ